MDTETLRRRIPEKELVFTATRSSGPGGQNVNKVSTRIELRFNIKKSAYLSESEKLMIFAKLKNKINAEGELIIVNQTERSQLKNKEKAIDKFYSMLSNALTVNPSRVSTRPTRSSVRKRIESKRIRASVKKSRGKIGDASDE
jgi:ribosome-associated protein